ncbi:MAG: hypothetical protein ABI855_01150 [Bacteroidota bacterium]
MSEVAEGVVQRASNQYGKNSHQHKSFGWSGYVGKSDVEKTAVSRLVHKQGTERLAELAGQGLTDAILLDLRTKITKSDDDITVKRQRVSERDGAVNERVRLANDLYAELVKLADTGKHLYEDTNESKYNDYVIYESTEGTQTVTGAVPAASIHQPSVVVNSVNDELEISVTEGVVTVYFSDDPTDEPAPGQVTAEVTSASPFSGKASDLAWSATNFRLLLKNAAVADDAPFTVVVRG